MWNLNSCTFLINFLFYVQDTYKDNFDSFFLNNMEIDNYTKNRLFEVIHIVTLILENEAFNLLFKFNAGRQNIMQ